MRLPWALVLGALVGIAQANDAIQTGSPESQTALVRRQDDSSSTTDAPAPEDTTSADTGGSDSTTSDAGDTGGDSTTTDAGSDTTVFRTTTVSNDDVSTVSSRTTVLVTSTKVVVITHTDFTTTTVTSSDQKTATKTVYETSTSMANEKRAINLAPRTLSPADAEAAATISAPVPVNTNDSYELVKDKRDGNLAKRATVTEVVTVTADGGDATTVVNTITNTLVRTSTSDTTSVQTVTETEQADATTTRTITSTLIVVSTVVTTGESTQTQTDSTSNPTDDAGSSDGDSSSGSGSGGGLSTGAKAGIGAGVGVAALLVLGALAFFFIKRRRSGPKPHPDDFIGASEVPVGGPVGGGHRTPPMSQHSATAAAFLAPNRTPPKQSVSPEGYRGTAAGDGRAGYAKPAPFGSAYAQPTNRSSTLVSNTSTAPTNNDYLPEHSHPMPAEMGGAETAAATRQQPVSHAAELGSGGGGANKWHVTNAAEMDSSQAVTPVSPQSAAPAVHVQPPPPPGQDVYEMPAQRY